MEKSIATLRIEEYQKGILVQNGLDPEKIKQFYAYHKDFSKMKTLYEDSFIRTSDDPNRTLKYAQNKWNKYLNNDISDYQDPHEYVQLKLIEESIRTSIEEFGYPFIDFPKIGTILTPNVNATVFSFPDISDKIILIRVGLLEYFTSLIKTVLILLDWELENDQLSATPNPESAISKISMNGDLLHNIFYNLGVVITNKLDIESNVNNKYYQNYMYNHLSFIRASIWRFIMGHEYAHILNGDFDNSPLMFDGTIKNPKNSRFSINYLNEFHADARGFELMNKYMIEHFQSQFTFSIIGSCLFFSGIDLLYSIIADILEFDFYKKVSLTHPNPNDRWLALAHNIYQNSPDKEQTLDALQTADRFTQIVNVIFSFREGFVKYLRGHKTYIQSAWS